MNKSIQRAIAILDCLVKSPRPLGISEIARQLDIPKSSAPTACILFIVAAVSS